MLFAAQIKEKEFLTTCANQKLNINNTLLGRKYTLFKILAASENSKIYLAVNGENKKQYAVKYYDLAGLNPEVAKQKRREIYSRVLFLRRSSSECFLECEEVYSDDEHIAVVLEYCCNGSLQELVRTRKVTAQDGIDIIKQVYGALDEILCNGYCIKSLKLSDILSKNGQFKLNNLSFLQHQKTKTNEQILNPPENLKGNPNEEQIHKYQVWLLGLLYLSILFKGYQRIQQEMKRIRQGTLKGAQSLFTKDLEGSKECISLTINQKYFLKHSLTLNPYERMDWINMMDIEAFQSVQIYRSQILIVDLLYNNRQSVFNQCSLIEMSEEEMKKEINPRNFSFVTINKSDILYYTEDTDHQEQELFEKLEKDLFSTQKANYILQNILSILEKKLSLKKRENIELLYLIASRCFLDVSLVNIKEREKKTQIVSKYFNKIKCVYHFAKAKFQYYSKLLQKEQSKFFSIVQDKLTPKQELKTQDLFLGGIERLDYQKQEQIHFTQKYLHKVISKLEQKQPYSPIIHDLKIYRQLCLGEKSKDPNKNFEIFIEQLSKKAIPIS